MARKNMCSIKFPESEDVYYVEDKEARDLAKSAVRTVNGRMPDKNGNVQLQTDETLTMRDGILSVNMAQAAEEDNTLPITSAAVYTAVGNIEILLGTI